MRRFLKKVLENGREEKRGVVYGWYTGGIRRIYGDIRGYTQYIVSIAMVFAVALKVKIAYLH